MSLWDYEVAMIGKAIEGLAQAVFGDEVSRVETVKRFVGVLHWIWSLPFVLGNECTRNTDMAFSPFELVKFGKVLDKVRVGLKGFGDLAKVDYSGSRELIPEVADNGMG